MEPLTTNNIITLVLGLGVIFVFFIRLGPRIDTLEKDQVKNEEWQEKHKRWADEQIKSHVQFEKAMVKLAENTASIQDWLRTTDQRLIDHLSDSKWDKRTERRNS